MSSTGGGTSDLVSVVIPIYNAASTLDACLGSVEAQTHRNLEIICVDDGSTDASRDVIHAHARKDGRIVVIEKPNEGYGASCNRGIAIARGTWVAVVEPDDLLEPTGYEDLLACAERCGGPTAVDVVKGAYWRSLPAADGTETRASCPYRGRVRPPRQPFAVGDGVELLRHHPAIWAAVYRRAYLSERGIRFPEIPGAGWADNPFLVETLCQTDRIAYTDACVYVYHERDLREAESFAGRSPLVPLQRWNDMMDVAERIGVTDRRVLSALALRGVNYALITVEGSKPGDSDVEELVRSSMGRLDPDLVFSEPAISPAGRRLFARARGLGEPRGGRLSRAAYLAREALYRLRANGASFAVRTLRARLRGRVLPHPGDAQR